MAKIYLVRHGQTAWNAEKIFRGRHDVPLNDMGRREAACCATALVRVPLARIYTSPLTRARETADVIAAGREVPVISDEAFTDLDFGDWTGRSMAEVERAFPKEYERWKRFPHLMRFPGGESLEDVQSRAMGRLGILAKLHSHEEIAVVSHRVVLKVLLCRAKGLDLSHFWSVRIDTCAISALEPDGQIFNVVLENDVRHLAALREGDGVDF